MRAGARRAQREREERGERERREREERGEERREREREHARDIVLLRQNPVKTDPASRKQIASHTRAHKHTRDKMSAMLGGSSV